MANHQSKRRWQDLSPVQRAIVTAGTLLQISLALSAWIDLARRPAARVRGSKLRWAATIGINFLGPIAYFVRGRRR